MKPTLLFLAVIVLTLSSCSTTFYQLYEVQPEQGITKSTDALIFEDANCRITYNLWEDEGNSGFKFFNKTNENLIVHLDESFFILNGIAYDYYKNRITSTSTNVITTSSSSNAYSLLFGGFATRSTQITSSGDRGVAIVEKSQIVIPPQTSKVIAEYAINHSLFRSCDLFRYPSKSQISTQNFSASNSPIVFKNLIKYRINNQDMFQTIENNFYVSAITNYPEKEFIDERNKEFCGEKEQTKGRYYVKYSPDRFYIKYEKPKSSKPTRH